MPKRLLTSILGFLVLTALGLVPATVAAQSIAVNKTSQATFLADKSGKQFSHSYTPSTTQALWVNKNECQQDLKYQVSITATGIQGNRLEVWAAGTSTDCSTQAARYTTSTAVCWRVYEDTAQNGTYTISIRVQDVVAQHYVSDVNSQYSATAADCNAAALNIASGGVGIRLSFYVFSGLTTGTPTYSDSWDQIGFDLIGPSPPETVSVGIADTELHLRWNSILDSDRAGFHIYCAPGVNIDAGVSAGGAAATGGASATGGDDAGVENLDCANPDIAAGAPPPPNMSPKGSVSTITATDAYASGLSNGTLYACALSVTDVMGNDGLLSPVVCGTPQPVNDIFTAYRAAGGKGGGGFCSIGRPGSVIGQMIPLACLALLALRRRGPGRSKSDDGSR